MSDKCGGSRLEPNATSEIHQSFISSSGRAHLKITFRKYQKRTGLLIALAFRAMVVSENASKGTSIRVAGHSLFYGHDAKEDNDHHQESEIGWELHVYLTL